MQPANLVQLGFNARLFPANWRPVLHEIGFGAVHHFAALQFPGKEEGLSAEHLGAEIKAVRQSLEDAAFTAVMEIVVGVDERGYTRAGNTPVDVLVANLPAIAGLPSRCVHMH